MTLRRQFVTFYSHTRRALWTKGETSGNRLQVVDAWTDCDQDSEWKTLSIPRGKSEDFKAMTQKYDRGVRQEK